MMLRVLLSLLKLQRLSWLNKSKDAQCLLRAEKGEKSGVTSRMCEITPFLLFPYKVVID